MKNQVPARPPPTPTAQPNRQRQLPIRLTANFTFFPSCDGVVRKHHICMVSHGFSQVFVSPNYHRQGDESAGTSHLVDMCAWGGVLDWKALSDFEVDVALLEPYEVEAMHVACNLLTGSTETEGAKGIDARDMLWRIAKHEDIEWQVESITNGDHSPISLSNAISSLL